MPGEKGDIGLYPGEEGLKEGELGLKPIDLAGDGEPNP